MEFFDAVKQRYSHKELFLPKPVPLSDLEKIADAGLRAPTGNNSQCVRLIILPDRASVQKLCDIAPGKALQSAPSAIAVVTGPGNRFQVEDYSAAASQMLLAAVALGYVSLWLDSPFFDEERQKAALKVLGLPEDHHLWVVLPVGLPDGSGSKRDKLSFEERVSYEIFGKQKTG